MIEYVLSVCRSLFREVVIVTKDPEAFSAYPEEKVQDVVDAGVLGGLYTAILKASTPFVFCVACDMPFLRPELVRFLLSQRDGHDAVVPRGPDGLHPLCAVYSKDCLPAFAKAISQGERRIASAFGGLNIRFCQPKEIAQIDPSFWSFFNVNTPEELRRAEEILRGRCRSEPGT